MHSIMDPTVGTCAGSIVELTDVLTMDIHIPTEDIHIPTEDIQIPTEDIQIPTEDIQIPILTASDNILVKFLLGRVLINRAVPGKRRPYEKRMVV